MMSRGYSLFYMGLTAICVVAGVGALAAWIKPVKAVVDFSVSESVWFGRSNRGFEEALLNFKVDVDLTESVFMNTRLFYSYIIAEWESKPNDKHSIILWNQLIKKEEPHYVGVDVPGNFTFRQVGSTMKGQTVNLTFAVQQVPYVGFFKTERLLTKQFTLPAKYHASVV